MEKQPTVSREEEIKRIISCSLKRYKKELSIRSAHTNFPMFSLLIQDEIQAVERVQSAMMELMEHWRAIHAENTD